MLTLSTILNAGDAEKALSSSQGGAFLGIRVATMNSDGNLYLLEHPVARLLITAKAELSAPNRRSTGRCRASRICGLLRPATR